MRAISATKAAFAVALGVSGCAGSGKPRVVHDSVPRIRNEALLQAAYKTLHHAGFRVSVRIPPRWQLGEMGYSGGYYNRVVVRAVLPRVGTPARAALRRGDVVTLLPEEGEFADPTSSINPHAVGRTPNLVGKPAATARGSTSSS